MAARTWNPDTGRASPGSASGATNDAEQPSVRTLVLGIGNVLMGDEGVGVHVVRELEAMVLPEGVACLDGGTGGLQLLGPVQQAERVILIDATADGRAVGTVRRLQPRFSSDYPRTLTGHDIGLKDLLDTVYLLGIVPAVTLFVVSVETPRDVSVGLSKELAAVVPQVARRVVEEIEVCGPGGARLRPDVPVSGA